MASSKLKIAQNSRMIATISMTKIIGAPDPPKRDKVIVPIIVLNKRATVTFCLPIAQLIFVTKTCSKPFKGVSSRIGKGVLLITFNTK